MVNIRGSVLRCDFAAFQSHNTQRPVTALNKLYFIESARLRFYLDFTRYF